MTSPTLIRPPRLNPGDTIRVVAPSGPVPQEEFEAGIRLLQVHYKTIYDPATLFQSTGYLAGSDEHRAQDLTEAIADPKARAIIMARGGYGLLRILPFLNPDLLRKNPKPLVGFSDGTALLAYAARAGVAAIHGPVVTQLPRLPKNDFNALTGLLQKPDGGLLVDGLESLIPGRVHGPLMGGNLEVFSRLLGTPFLPDLSGAILVIEDIGERPYRVDRLLTHLDLAGVFNTVAAVVVGDFLDCKERDDSKLTSPPVNEILEERLGRLAIPVVFNAPIGHAARNVALPFGTMAELDTRHGTLTALQGAVA